MDLSGAISRFGSALMLATERFGHFAAFAATVAWWCFARPARWCRSRRMLPQLYAVGVASIPVVAITGAFIGMVLALEGYEQFRAFEQETRLGGVINISVVKQIGPVLAAVMVAGRVGGALAAELGTMRVTEQLDSLRAMATDPILHLVVPRVVACIVMTPLLTVYSDLLGVWGGWLVTVQMYGVSSFQYWEFTAYFVSWWEPVSGLIKAVFFGASIGLIACYKGFHCAPGAAGVGRAATEAFVTSFLAIIMINLLLAKLLNTINVIFIERGALSAFG
jgi:phospholipid/cholesterol/gamma-HCH transport system permease protein